MRWENFNGLAQAFFICGAAARSMSFFVLPESKLISIRKSPPICVIFVIVLGVYPQLIFDFCETAAGALLGM